VTVFRVWAPAAGRVEADVAGRSYPMTPGGRPGWWMADVPGAVAGSDYAFRLDGGEPLPDPRAPRLPSGPHGPGRTYDHAAFRWSDGHWRGAPSPGAVVYEVHVGTFTPDGTLDAAIARLDHLEALGVTAVELMPLAAFPGEHGWGYDGIGLWAVHEPYGGPDALKRFADACHARGLAVYLDVVYNHVGPGNRLASFGPYFTSAHVTPWGPAVNLDQPGSDEVRSFIVGNALMWLRDYHLDGLRIDAVHALADHRNDPRLITAREAGGYGLGAQWDDDFHHAVHALVTGERQGYYADFGALAGVAKTLTRGYFYDGTWSSFRGRSHGRPVDTLRIPAHRFVGFLQDHDQVGNRATGDRIVATLRAARPDRAEGLLRVAAGLVLTGPFTPMLFMGEEWGADTPWQYFTDHTDPGLAATVSSGRRSEFAAHGWGFADVPDPQDKETFLRSKLDWTQPDREPYRSILGWYRALIALRRSRTELCDPRLDQVRADYDEEAGWLVLHRGSLLIAAALGPASARVPLFREAGGDGRAVRRLRLLLASDTRVSVNANSADLPAASFAVIEESSGSQLIT
jgi:maltooligosyltrehalose trehalohydrolase